MNIPYIHVHSNGSFEIIGSEEALESLGKALTMKAKMGKRFQCTLTDGYNPAITITSDKDFQKEG